MSENIYVASKCDWRFAGRNAYIYFIDVKKFFLNQKTQNHFSVQVLCQSGCNISPQSLGQFSPVLLAVRNSDVRSLEVLLKHGANVNAINIDGRDTLLHVACRNKNFGKLYNYQCAMYQSR